MKRKIEYVKNYLEYDEDLIDHLNTLNQQGWQLKKLIYCFFIYEKTDCRVKYQADYNKLSEDYANTLKELGYQQVVCCDPVHIYENENLNADDLNTDLDIYFDSKMHQYKKWGIVFIAVTGILFLAFGDNMK